jgi:hypothetical protein
LEERPQVNTVNDKEARTMGYMIAKRLRLIVVLVAMCGMVPPAWATAMETRPTSLTFAYVRTEDQPITQWLIMIYTEALNRMGIDLVFETLPAKRASWLSDIGKVDGELNRVADYNREWPDMIRVEEHNMRGTFAAFATDPGISLEGWESLGGTEYKVEYRRGIKECEIYLPRVVPAERLSQISTIELGVKKLLAGRTDIFVTLEGPMMSFLASQAFQDIRQEIGQGKMIHKVGTMETVLMYAWLNKAHSALAPQLAEILGEMKAEGLFERYRDQVGILPAELTW